MMEGNCLKLLLTTIVLVLVWVLFLVGESTGWSFTTATTTTRSTASWSGGTTTPTGHRRQSFSRPLPPLTGQRLPKPHARRRSNCCRRATPGGLRRPAAPCGALAEAVACPGTGRAFHGSCLSRLGRHSHGACVCQTTNWTTHACGCTPAAPLTLQSARSQSNNACTRWSMPSCARVVCAFAAGAGAVGKGMVRVRLRLRLQPQPHLQLRLQLRPRLLP